MTVKEIDTTRQPVGSLYTAVRTTHWPVYRCVYKGLVMMCKIAEHTKVVKHCKYC
jgi:hypothetical protein